MPLRAAPAPLAAWAHDDLLPVGSIAAPPAGVSDPVAWIRDNERWLAANGCTHARGPMGPTTWHGYRANLGPHDRAPFMGEPSADPTPWRAAGYQVAAQYQSNLADNMHQAASAEDRSCALVTAGWQLQTLDQLPGGFEQALRILHALSVRAFAHAHAYTPLAFDEFASLYRPVEPIVDPRMVFIATAPSGDTAGFCFCVPDRQQPGLRQFLVKTLAVDPRYRQHGVGSWLVAIAHGTADELGWTGGGIHALMWSGSHSQSISAHAGQVIRRYALFERALTDGDGADR